MSEQFAQQVMRIAVAQICQNADFGNFDTAEGHAFELLVEVVGKYIEKIGRLTRRYTEHDGRTESTLLDVLQAFEKLEPNRVDWRNLERMCREVPWQVPYTSGVPEFPVDRRKRRTPYGESKRDAEAGHAAGSEWVAALKRARLGESGDAGKGREHPSYVPSHLPDFPERHTYLRTDVAVTERETDPKVILERNLADKRRVQQALASIHNSVDNGPSTSFGAINDDAPAPGTTGPGVDEPLKPEAKPEDAPAAKLPAAFQ